MDFKLLPCIYHTVPLTKPCLKWVKIELGLDPDRVK
jgi:hypothetical protein